MNIRRGYKIYTRVGDFDPPTHQPTSTNVCINVHYVYMRYIIHVHYVNMYLQLYRECIGMAYIVCLLI